LKINSITALLIVVGILIVIGGIYFVRNSQDAKEVQASAKKGEETGRLMMGGGGDARAIMQQRMKSRPSPP